MTGCPTKSSYTQTFPANGSLKVINFFNGRPPPETQLPIGFGSKTRPSSLMWVADPEMVMLCTPQNR